MRERMQCQGTCEDGSRCQTRARLNPEDPYCWRHKDQREEEE